MISKHETCEIELIKFKDVTVPTNLIFNYNDSGPEFLFYENNPDTISYGFCDLVIRHNGEIVGTLSSGQLSEELVKSYIKYFNIRDTMKTVNIEFEVPFDDSYLNRNDWEELYSKFEKSGSYNKQGYTKPELDVSFCDWVTNYDDGKIELNKYSKPKFDENGKLIYCIRKEKKYTREDLVNTARWAFHFYKGDQSLSDDEMEEKFEELLLKK